MLRLILVLLDSSIGKKTPENEKGTGY